MQQKQRKDREPDRRSYSRVQDRKSLHPHSLTRTWFPCTTPEATEISASPEIRRVARATPCLTGASMVLLPLLSLAVKVMTVPSETGFPAQSWTASVCTTTPFGVFSALKCSL